MQTLGSTKGLKKEIEKDFSIRLEDFREEKKTEFDREIEKIKEAHKKELSKIRRELEKEEQKAYQNTLAEEIFETKKDFEKHREEVIVGLFSEAKKQSQAILLDKDYIDKVKKITDKTKIIGNLEEYRKHFPDIEIHKNIDGIIVYAKNHLYDFTFDKFIGTQKADLRYKVGNMLR